MWGVIAIIDKVTLGDSSGWVVCVRSVGALIQHFSVPQDAHTLR